MIPKTSAFIIHNNSKKRKVFREEIQNLLESLKINLNYISEQKIYSQEFNNIISIKLQNLHTYLNRELFNLIHKRSLLQINFILFFKQTILPFFIQLIKIIFGSREDNINLINHNSIEKIVRNKHIKAWERFLKTDTKFLLVFEDDAICKSNSRNMLKNILEILYEENPNNFYLDLGGGYELNNVLPLKKSMKNKYFDLYFDRLYTNTACSYLLTRDTVIEFIKIIHKDNYSKNFPIDHLLNYLGFKSKKNIYSAHFFNPIFTHGSFKDIIESWQSLE